MLTEEQKQQILNSPNFQNLIKKPIEKEAEQTANLSFTERARIAREKQRPLPKAPTLPPQKKEGFFDTLKETGKNAFESVKKRGEKFGESLIAMDIPFTEKDDKIREQLNISGQSIPETFGQGVSGAVLAGGDVAFDAIKGIGKYFNNLSDNKIKEFVKPLTDDLKDIGAFLYKAPSNVLSNIRKEDPQLASIIEDKANSFKDKLSKISNNDRLMRDLDIPLAVLELIGAKKAEKPISEAIELAGDTAGNLAKRSGEIAGDVKKGIGEGIESVKTGIEESTTGKAITQVGSDLAERFPRAKQRLAESAVEKAERFDKIKNSSPSVAKAIKSDLDERIIETVSLADSETKKAFKEVLDIAEESTKTSSLKNQPSKVSGDLASKQFDLINKEKKRVGASIGEEIKRLSKTDKINIDDTLLEASNILESQGIKIGDDGVLDFAGTNLPPSQRSKVKELFELVNESGNQLSPLEIQKKDQLFSKLQREAKMSEIGDILIDTDEGLKSLFNVFRDIYSKKLDTVSPEIKALNKQYRDLSLITEDIEDSIFRTPNFNITKTADPAEFAKVNLRRIFGEAQSSPVFEAIADQMDELARQLGYAGATPKEVAEFAQSIRKLYPESVPKAGFTGGISTGITNAITDVAGKVLKAGAPNVADQRKALINLLTEENPFLQEPFSTN